MSGSWSSQYPVPDKRFDLSIKSISGIQEVHSMSMADLLTHCSRVTHICGSGLTIISSDNDLLPGQCHAIIWTNDGILLIGPLGTIVSEILIKLYSFSFRKMHLKMLSGKWRPFCLGLSVLLGKSRTWHEVGSYREINAMCFFQSCFQRWIYHYTKTEMLSFW